jgi:hypothetical protein
MGRESLLETSLCVGKLKGGEEDNGKSQKSLPVIYGHKQRTTLHCVINECNSWSPFNDSMWPKY